MIPIYPCEIYNSAINFISASKTVAIQRYVFNHLAYGPVIEQQMCVGGVTPWPNMSNFNAGCHPVSDSKASVST